MQAGSKPQHLVSDQDNRVASCGICVRCGAFRNRDVGFWLILRRKGRYCAIFTSEFNQAPIRASTRCISVVVNFVDANVARGSGLGVILFGARSSCAQYDCLYRTCTIGLSESGIVSATAETPTILRSLLRNFGHNRLVCRRIRGVGGIVRVRICCRYAARGSIRVAPLITLVASSAATTTAVS